MEYQTSCHFQTLQKILTWITNPTRHIDECQNILLQIAIAKQTIHRLDIDINTLVAPLVASACRDKTASSATSSPVRARVMSSNACVLPRACGRTPCLWYKVVLKAVWQNYVNRLVEQFGQLRLGETPVGMAGKNINHYRFSAQRRQILRHLLHNRPGHRQVVSVQPAVSSWR